MCSIHEEGKNEYFLPKSLLVFKTKDGTIYREKLGVRYEFHHEEYDFISYGPKTMGQKHRDAMKRKPNFMFSSFDLKLSPFGWCEKQWSIEPKSLGGSFPSPAFELEPGKEIDVLVTLFYYSHQNEQRGEQMGPPKSLKCVVGTAGQQQTAAPPPPAASSAPPPAAAGAAPPSIPFKPDKTFDAAKKYFFRDFGKSDEEQRENKKQKHHT